MTFDYENINTMYAEETLNEYSDDGTMVESREALTKAVVGHRIVKVEQRNLGGYYNSTIIALDNGHEVRLRGNSDCCAYTDVRSFLLHPDKIDHVIMGVGTTDEYSTWHIYADWGDVLKLEVGWSCGNPFYYGYGFDIKVVPISSVDTTLGRL